MFHRLPLVRSEKRAKKKVKKCFSFVKQKLEIVKTAKAIRISQEKGVFHNSLDCYDVVWCNYGWTDVCVCVTGMFWLWVHGNGDWSVDWWRLCYDEWWLGMIEVLCDVSECSFMVMSVNAHLWWCQWMWLWCQWMFICGDVSECSLVISVNDHLWWCQWILTCDVSECSLVMSVNVHLWWYQWMFICDVSECSFVVMSVCGHLWWLWQIGIV